MVLIFNVMGLVMFAAGMGFGIGVAHMLGSSNEALAMLLGGPLLAILDYAVRQWRHTTLFGRSGGSLFFLPVWLWGLAWTVLGAIRLVRGH